MSFKVDILESAKKALPLELRQKIRYFQKGKLRPLQELAFRALMGSDLKALAVAYGSDKWNSHWYAQHYETHFAPRRLKKLNVLEIGIGGYDDPQGGGGSLRMWKTYFPKSNIYGIDIYDKSFHDQKRIKTFKGSQIDNHFLSQVLQEIGSVDIIIDDGSHMNEHILHSFDYLFPRLKNNGFYVIEDIQTSYWQEYGGSYKGLSGEKTAMSFFKDLSDGLNYKDFRQTGYVPNFYDENIVSIHFYHNLVFIEKGDNTNQ